jgi:tRNA dimethylallyltransferase
MLGLGLARTELYAQIDRRVEAMMEAGLLDEVVHLVQTRGPDLPALSALGYAQLRDYLVGRVSLEQAIALIKRDSRRLARRQFAWFRLEDPAIVWYDSRRARYADILAQTRRRLEAPS